MRKLLVQLVCFLAATRKKHYVYRKMDIKAFKGKGEFGLLRQPGRLKGLSFSKPWTFASVGAVAVLMGCAFTSPVDTPLVFDGSLVGQQNAAGINGAVRDGGSTRLRLNGGSVGVVRVSGADGVALPVRVVGDEVILAGEHLELQVVTTAGLVRVLTAKSLDSLAVVEAQQPQQLAATAVAVVAVKQPVVGVEATGFAASGNAASVADASAGLKLKLDTRFESIQYAALFSYANGNLGPQARNMLDRTAEAAQGAQAVNLVGRTDASGDRGRNVQIANGRVTAVRMYLVEKGVEPSIIKASTVVAERVTDESGLEPVVRTQMAIKGVSVARLSRRVDIGIEKPNKAAVAAQIKSGVLL